MKRNQCRRKPLPFGASMKNLDYRAPTIGTSRKSFLSVSPFSFFSPPRPDFFPSIFLFFFFLFSFLSFYFYFSFFLVFIPTEFFFCSPFFVGLIPSERKLPLTFLPSLSWPCVFIWSMYHMSCVTWTHALGVTFHTTWISFHVSYSNGGMW